MKSIWGYALAGLGLIGMALSSTIGKKFAPFLESIPKEFILYPSLILVGLGVIILIMNGSSSSKLRQAEKEVPIYKGEGKHRKIIGYKVEE
ncbi:MAG: hypothetical protein AABX16_02610 [Nanoarchaeota archaeon]